MFNFIKKNYYRIIGYFPGKIGGHTFKLDHHNWYFWRKVRKGKWEPETFEVLSQSLKPESVYCDVGTWIGPTVLYAAKHCRQVICFEPDPLAYKHLTTNLHANNIRNVDSYNVALAKGTGVYQMGSFGSSLGDSMTSLLKKDDDSSGSFKALVLDWDMALDLFSLQKVDVLKIDVEGGEFSLIPAMKDYLLEYKPVVWLSLHVPFLSEEETEEKLGTLIDTMSFYKNCFDQNLNKVDIKSLNTEENKKGFPAFLFTN